MRDRLLGKEPQDYDLATTALPREVLKYFRDQSDPDLMAFPTGIDHGTITVVYQKQQIEITTLRQDIATDGRHAQVQFGTSFEADALRRDFTINALSEDRSGKIYDYYGGIEDLRNKVVRFVGDAHQRIHEDYLRILRFYRFCLTLGFSPDPSALDAIAELTTHISALSAERVFSEHQKIIGSLSLPASATAHQPALLAHWLVHTWSIWLKKGKDGQEVKTAQSNEIEHTAKHADKLAKHGAFSTLFEGLDHHQGGQNDGEGYIPGLINHDRNKAQSRDLGRLTELCQYFTQSWRRLGNSLAGDLSHQLTSTLILRAMWGCTPEQVRDFFYLMKGSRRQAKEALLWYKALEGSWLEKSSRPRAFRLLCELEDLDASLVESLTSKPGLPRWQQKSQALVPVAPDIVKEIHQNKPILRAAYHNLHRHLTHLCEIIGVERQHRELRKASPLLSSDELMNQLGYKGKTLGAGVRHLQNLQWLEELTSPTEAINYLRTHGPSTWPRQSWEKESKMAVLKRP